MTAIQVRAAQDSECEALEPLFAHYLPRVARIAAARIGRSWNEFTLDGDIVATESGWSICRQGCVAR